MQDRVPQHFFILFPRLDARIFPARLAVLLDPTGKVSSNMSDSRRFCQCASSDRSEGLLGEKIDFRSRRKFAPCWHSARARVRASQTPQFSQAFIALGDDGVLNISPRSGTRTKPARPVSSSFLFSLHHSSRSLFHSLLFPLTLSLSSPPSLSRHLPFPFTRFNFRSTCLSRPPLLSPSPPSRPPPPSKRLVLPPALHLTAFADKTLQSHSRAARSTSLSDPTLSTPPLAPPSARTRAPPSSPRSRTLAMLTPVSLSRSSRARIFLVAEHGTFS